MGAAAGDPVLIDVPPSSAKVSLTFEVPYGVAGGEIVAINSPSGHLKLVTLPADALAGASLTVRISDEPDAADAAGRAPQQRVALLGRSFHSATKSMAKSGRLGSKAKPVFVSIQAAAAQGPALSVPNERI